MRAGFRELMGLAALVVVVLAGCATGDGTTTTDPPASTTEGRELPESPPEESLAPRRQLLYRQCDEGDDEACTELASITDEGSDEYRFAVTCGERETEPVCAPPEE